MSYDYAIDARRDAARRAPDPNTEYTWTTYYIAEVFEAGDWPRVQVAKWRKSAIGEVEYLGNRWYDRPTEATTGDR